MIGSCISHAAFAATLTLGPPPPPPAPPQAPSASASTSPVPAAEQGGSDLTARAPVPKWTLEGHAKGEKPTHTWTERDDKKLRRASITTLAGTGIAVLGIAGVVAGSVMFASQPAAKLEELESDNGGALPAGDAKRQRHIRVARATPWVYGISAGVAVAGVVTAIIGGIRFKKLRERKRTSAVAFGVMPAPRGAGLNMEVRF